MVGGSGDETILAFECLGGGGRNIYGFIADTNSQNLWAESETKANKTEPKAKPKQTKPSRKRSQSIPKAKPKHPKPSRKRSQSKPGRAESEAKANQGESETKPKQLRRDTNKEKCLAVKTGNRNVTEWLWPEIFCSTPGSKNRVVVKSRHKNFRDWMWPSFFCTTTLRRTRCWPTRSSKTVQKNGNPLNVAFVFLHHDCKWWPLVN